MTPSARAGNLTDTSTVMGAFIIDHTRISMQISMDMYTLTLADLFLVEWLEADWMEFESKHRDHGN